MIYPKNVIEFVKTDPNLAARFPTVAAVQSLNSSLVAAPADLAFAEYMLSEGHTTSRAIRRYLHFLSSMYDVFTEIYQFFPKYNQNSTHKDDVGAIGTAPYELFYHAMYLYCLDSWGVKGDVIECGTYKGFSAACLSWVCDYLDRKLIVADSFAGLPENSTDPYYKKGDFCGQFDEVVANIEDFGKIAQVEFLQGFYETSLRGFNRPLCMLWMDVDLYESSMDIMNNLFHCLAADGVLISHELFAERDFADGQLKATIGPAKALAAFFGQHQISYQAMPLENGSGLVVPCPPGHKLHMSCTVVQYIRDHCRLADTLFAQQRTSLVNDIGHWHNEVDKLMRIYQATADFKAKKAIKSLLAALGLAKKKTDA